MNSHLICQPPARATGAANPSPRGSANPLLVQLEAQAGVWRVVFPPRQAAPCGHHAARASHDATRGAMGRDSGEWGAAEPCSDRSCAGDRRSSDRPTVDRLAGAQKELEQLHVEEFARLLAHASAMRLQLERRGAGDLESLAWRSALADQCAAAAADGAQLSSALAALLELCRAPLELWPSACELALAAASLWPGARTRAALGRVALADRDWRSARGCFESALDFPTTERMRGEVLEVLDTLEVRERESTCCEPAVRSTAGSTGGSVAHSQANPSHSSRSSASPSERQ